MGLGAFVRTQARFYGRGRVCTCSSAFLWVSVRLYAFKRGSARFSILGVFFLMQILVKVDVRLIGQPRVPVSILSS